MKHLTMTTAFVLGLSSFAVPAVVSAQEALSSCNPVTGLTPSGGQCVTLTPVNPTRYQTQIEGEGASSYRPVEVGELAETYECNTADRGVGYGAGGALLIEDCGSPLALDPATFKEFVGYAGNAAPVPAPAPAYVAPLAPPAPVYVAPPPVTVAAPIVPAPPVFSAPTGIMAAGLGNAGLIAGGLAAAGLIGIIALAASDDDDNDAATSTRN